jgi:tetratricopeptide (TPR) repeat protein
VTSISETKTIRGKRGLLQIDTLSGQATFEGRALSITAHWLYVYALLGLNALDGQPAVAFEEVNRLPTWTHVEAKSVRTSIFRHAESVRDAGLELIVSPVGERTKRFLLNPKLIRHIQFDVTLDRVRCWLGLSFASDLAPSHDVRVLAWINSAEMAFEQGRYDDSEVFIAQVLEAKAALEHHVRVMALASWIKSFRASREVAWDAMLELHALRKSQPLAPALQAIIWLQEGRFYLKHRDAQAAKRAYTSAAKLAASDDERTLGAIQAGLGYLAQWDNKLDEALRRYETALGHYSKAHWAWAMQAQYNNIAAICFLQHARFETRDPKKAAKWLADAIRWLEDTKAFGDQMDFGGAADLEVNLAYAYRLTEKYQAARDMLRYGWNLAHAGHCIADQGLVCAELAELEEALGNRSKAIVEYGRAIEFFSEVEMQDWLKACQNRLSELREEIPLGKALKLW